MKIELITKVADLVIKTGILTTLAIGIRKYVEKPKATPAPVYYTTPSDEDDSDEDEDE